MKYSIIILALIITSLISCQNKERNMIADRIWKCNFYGVQSDNCWMPFGEKNPHHYIFFNKDGSGYLQDYGTEDSLSITKWKLTKVDSLTILELFITTPKGSQETRQTIYKSYHLKFLKEDSLILSRPYFTKESIQRKLDLNEVYRLTPANSEDVKKCKKARDSHREEEEHQKRIKEYKFKKLHTIEEVVSDSCRVWSSNGDMDLTFKQTKMNLWITFMGQCIYEFPIKIENGELFVLWIPNEDCIFESSFKKTFGLTDYPKRRSKFMSLKLINDSTLESTYYFPRWVERFNAFQKKFGIKRFDEYTGDSKIFFSNQFKFNKEASEFFIK